MPLEINREVFVTCAVPGSGGSQEKSSHVPRSPRAIAESAIASAGAGAGEMIAHCHAREPDSGAPSRFAHRGRPPSMPGAFDAALP